PDSTTHTPSRRSASSISGPRAPLFTTTTSTASLRNASRQRVSAAPLSKATTIAATRISPVLIGASPRENRWERLGEDRDVEPDRPVLEVVEVEPNEVVERQLDAARH